MAADRRDTDLHKPDGTIFQGEKIGHANKESHIRRRDGVIFKGDEIGYADPEKNVRRRDGVILKGDIVGKIKKDRAHAPDGLVFAGEQWGYVDDDGNIRQRDGLIFQGRIIGKMRGHNKEAALGFYVLRFNELVERFNQLEQEARRGDFKGKYLGRVRRMLELVPNFDGLGDIDNLIRRLRVLETELADEIHRQKQIKVRAKETIVREAERQSESSDWKAAGAEIKALQARWKEIGSAGNDDERLWQQFRSACDHFFTRRSAHFDELDRQRHHNAGRKRELCSAVESLRYSDDYKSAIARVKELQSTWKTIGPAPKDQDDELWNNFRHACDAVFHAAQRDWEHRHADYEARKADRERRHDEWERKQNEWCEKMHDTLRAKREQVARLRESVDHDEGNVMRWRDTIDDLRPGGRADEIRDSLESKISDVEDRIQAKERKIREIEDDIEQIESKLRG